MGFLKKQGGGKQPKLITKKKRHQSPNNRDVGQKTVEFMEVGGKEWEVGKDYISPEVTNPSGHKRNERSRSRDSPYDSPMKGGGDDGRGKSKEVIHPKKLFDGIEIVTPDDRKFREDEDDEEDFDEDYDYKNRSRSKPRSKPKGHHDRTDYSKKSKDDKYYAHPESFHISPG